MITIENKSHIEINEGYQSIKLAEFSINLKHLYSCEEVIELFIQTKKFDFHNFSDSIKSETDKPFLRQAFNFDKIKIEDFKKTDKNGVTKFLVEIINEPDWGDDRNDFVKLLDKYFEILNNYSDYSYYILSMEWFDLVDERVLKTERMLYSYYFLIISVNKKLNSLTLSEWVYD